MASQISSIQQATMNLRTLCDALGGIATKWFKIGIQLGIPHNKLLEFQGSPDPLSAVIDYWLRGNVIESANPISWNSVVIALQSKFVGEPGIAEEICKIYCQQEAGRDVKSVPSPEYKIDPDVRLDLELILERNLKDIISKYASYVDTLRIAVKKKQVPADDLRSYLLSVPATSKISKGQKLTLLSDKKFLLKECETITDIFNLLTTECASFLNYDIFQFIEKRYGIKHDQEELRYSEHLKAFIKKHNISEFAKINPELRSRIGSTELTLKCDIETTCNLAKLEELRKLIAEIMEISPSALEIVDIKEGCVIVTFFIPTSIANALFTPDTVFSQQQEEELRAAAVLWLRCDDHTFHFEEQNKFQNDAFDKLKQQLTCSVCLDTYIDPKQLQCQHTNCLDCLIGLVRQNQQGQSILICPECRQVTHLPTDGVVGLRADFRANQLLEIIGESQEELTVAKPSKLRSNERTASIKVAVSCGACCTDHDIILEVFCETCGEAICWKCTMKGNKHFFHECEALDDVFTQCKRRIQFLSETVEHAFAKFDTHSTEISDQQVVIENEIQRTISNDGRKTELISQLNQLTQEKLKGLTAQRDQVETIQAQLSKYHYFMEDTSNHKKTLLKKTTTVKQMKELVSASHTKLFEPSIEADTVFLSPALHSTENGKLCSKHSLDLSKYCTASKGIGLAVVGKTSTTILQNRCPVQITSISSELVFGLAGTRVRCKIEKKIGQSLYKISYQPTIKGNHQLYIKVNGNHISGSPFPVRVKSSPQDINDPSMTISNVTRPMGIAVNREGEILVTEEGAHQVTVFSPTGAKLYSFGTHGSGQGQFECPHGIALDEKRNIMVTDRKNHCIQKFTPKGEFLNSVGTIGSGPLKFYHPCGIAFNTSNNKVYVVDESSHIQVLNSDLSYFTTFERKLKFYMPRHMACDSKGNVYVTDWGSHRIQVFTAEGEFLKVIDQSSGELREPCGIAIDSSDKVYVSDWESNAIVSTSQGQFTTMYGSKGRKPGQFYFPTGIAIDNEVLYVCDYINNRIQVF